MSKEFESFEESVGLGEDVEVSENTLRVQNVVRRFVPVVRNAANAFFKRFAAAISWEQDQEQDEEDDVIYFDSCLTISEPGEYKQNGDIYHNLLIDHCIIINSDNVIVDGAGYSINSIGGHGSFGVLISGYDVTVKNLVLNDFAYGVVTEGASNSEILNNEINNMYRKGIYLTGGSSNNLVQGNTVQNANNCYSTLRSSYNAFEDNTAIACEEAAVLVRYLSVENTFERFTVRNAETAISVTENADDNYFEGFGLACVSEVENVESDCTGNTIKKITIKNCPVIGIG